MIVIILCKMTSFFCAITTHLMQNVSQINLLVEVLASRVRKDIQGVLIESAVTH